MAAALLRQMGAEALTVASAGVRKDTLDPFAAAAMAEAGIDISAHEPMTIEELEDIEGLDFDLIVTLSPEAASQPSATEAPGAETPAAAATSSPSAQNAETLLNTLDADGDGSVTKEEFKDGALALLGRSHRAERHDHDSASGETVEWHDHRSRRLERRLAKVFDRVDANDDGTLDASELASALEKTGRRGKKHQCCVPAAQASTDPAPVAQASYASVTVVAIAVKQYSAVSRAA